MLRAATRKSLEQGLKGIRAQATQAPAPPPPPPHVPKPAKRRPGRKLALAATALAVGASGVVGYAYMDPEFRHKVIIFLLICTEIMQR
ncbi:unnamed protein product [Cylicostephanus goldi]|uniref:Mitofilin n=1 Tax=Cylicostephanus goldi TaxID=71465 RepID=A0A3P6RNS4_CYLGO|nr:unnamed protein product [Cylicostephanus goldi]